MLRRPVLERERVQRCSGLRVTATIAVAAALYARGGDEEKEEEAFRTLIWGRRVPNPLPPLPPPNRARACWTEDIVPGIVQDTPFRFKPSLMVAKIESIPKDGGKTPSFKYAP